MSNFVVDFLIRSIGILRLWTLTVNGLSSSLHYVPYFRSACLYVKISALSRTKSILVVIPKYPYISSQATGAS